MKVNQYKVNDQEREELVTLIRLDETEWFEFIKRLVDNDVHYGKTNQKIEYNEIEQIDINLCAPFCNNEGFLKEYGANTKYISVISEELGHYSLRLWLGENGIRSTLSDVDNILNGDSNALYLAFNQWWQKIPLEPQIVEDTIMAKRTREYGVNHIQLWLKSLDKENPTAAVDKFFREVRLWAQAHELAMDWEDQK